jgi:hypothetical protein
LNLLKIRPERTWNFRSEGRFPTLLHPGRSEEVAMDFAERVYIGMAIVGFCGVLTALLLMGG